MPGTIHIPVGLTGKTLTVDAFPDGSDTAASTGTSLTEATNRDGLYTYSESTLTGLHHLIVRESSVPVYDCWAVLATSGTVTSEESRAAALHLPAIETDTQDLQNSIGTPTDLGSGETVADNLADLYEAETGQVVPWLVAHLDSTSGDNVFLRLSAHDGNLRELNITTLDATATGTLSVREYDAASGATTFTETFAATDLVNGAFEKTHASPGLTANKLYIATITITENGNTHTNRILLPVGP